MLSYKISVLTAKIDIMQKNKKNTAYGFNHLYCIKGCQHTEENLQNNLRIPATINSLISARMADNRQLWEKQNNSYTWHKNCLKFNS